MDEGSQIALGQIANELATIRARMEFSYVNLGGLLFRVDNDTGAMWRMVDAVGHGNDQYHKIKWEQVIIEGKVMPY